MSAQRPIPAPRPPMSSERIAEYEALPKRSEVTPEEAAEADLIVRGLGLYLRREAAQVEARKADAA